MRMWILLVTPPIGNPCPDGYFGGPSTDRPFYVQFGGNLPFLPSWSVSDTAAVVAPWLHAGRGADQRGAFGWVFSALWLLLKTAHRQPFQRATPIRSRDTEKLELHGFVQFHEFSASCIDFRCCRARSSSFSGGSPRRRTA